MVECHFAMGHIGQIAAARDNAAVCGAACSALLEGACLQREPGGMFQSYMTSLRVIHSVTRAIVAGIWVGILPKSASKNRADRRLRT